MADSSYEAVAAACREHGVPDAMVAPLADLYGRWRWASSEPTACLEELVAEYREYDLYLRSRRGDTAASEEFSRRWRHYALGALGWRIERANLDDLVSIFFERLYRLVGDDFAWRSPFTVYVRTMLVNVARTHLRRTLTRRSREVALDEADGPARHVAAEPNPEETALVAERRRAVEAVLAQVSPIDRHILLDALVEGVPAAETAARLGLRRDAVYKRLQRSRKRLAELLEAAGLGPSG